jgi:plasmid segregation protein ParM
MNLLISVDHGNSYIKSVAHQFPTGLIGQSADSKFADDVLTYNGQVYTLVKERNIPYMYDKSVNETFFILTLFAIGKELVTSAFRCVRRFFLL